MLRNLLAFLLILLAACDEGSGNGTAVIGPGGGVVTGEQGVTVTIPAGALASETTISTEVIQSDGLPPVPADLTPVGPFVSLTPHGTQFAAPVEVTLPYSSESSRLTVLRIDDENDTSWELLAGASFADETATVEVSRFSIVVVAPQGTTVTIPPGTPEFLAAECLDACDCNLIGDAVSSQRCFDACLVSHDWSSSEGCQTEWFQATGCTIENCGQDIEDCKDETDAHQRCLFPDPVDPPDIVERVDQGLLRPAGATALVVTERPYDFSSLKSEYASCDWAFDGGEVGGLIVVADFDESIDPIGDYFSLFHRPDGGVQWGLFDAQTNEEWEYLPDGEVTLAAKQVNDPREAAHDGEASIRAAEVALFGPIYRLRLRWIGDVQERFTGRRRPASVLIDCYFQLLDVPCPNDCDDGVYCTLDVCLVNGCLNEPAFGSLFIDTSEPQRALECNRENGDLGTCTAEGTCGDHACDGPCDDGDLDTFDYCEISPDGEGTCKALAL